MKSLINRYQGIMDITFMRWFVLSHPTSREVAKDVL
jgi:hypothetical protein